LAIAQQQADAQSRQPQPKVPVLDQAFEELGSAMARLRERLRALEERLDPVLEDVPREAASASPQAPTRNKTHIQVAIVTDAVKIMNANLDELMGRLTV
jgi:hypothetical protein